MISTAIIVISFIAGALVGFSFIPNDIKELNRINKDLVNRICELSDQLLDMQGK